MGFLFGTGQVFTRAAALTQTLPADLRADLASLLTTAAAAARHDIQHLASTIAARAGPSTGNAATHPTAQPSTADAHAWPWHSAAEPIRAGRGDLDLGQ